MLNRHEKQKVCFKYSCFPGVSIHSKERDPLEDLEI
jgi:hypothetical protein